MRMELKVYRSDSATAALVVGHGAGAGQNSPFMVRTAEGLAARGIAAATFDFPYMTARQERSGSPAGARAGVARRDRPGAEPN